MSAETTLYATLTAASAVTALVSTRVYPDVVPATVELPCVAFARLDTNYVTTIHTAVPLAETAVLEIACMAETRKAADDVADAVIAAGGAAGYLPVTRRAELDPDNNLWSTVLTVEFTS